MQERGGLHSSKIFFYPRRRNSLTRVAVTGWVKPNPSVFDILLADTILDGKPLCKRDTKTIRNGVFPRVSIAVFRKTCLNRDDTRPSEQIVCTGVDRYVPLPCLFCLPFPYCLFPAVFVRSVCRQPVTMIGECSETETRLLATKKTVYIKRI